MDRWTKAFQQVKDMLLSQRQIEIDKLKEEMAMASVKQKKGSVFTKIEEEKPKDVKIEEVDDVLDLGNLFALECGQN
jgi:hypothetical protein